MPGMKPDRPVQHGLFITGTDTGIGKTVVGTSLVRALDQAGVNVQPRKPVESGCLMQDGVLLPADGLAYRNALRREMELDVITPHRFAAALAPPAAARLENKTISLAVLEAAVLQNLPDNCLCIAEGAGGFYSPIADDGLNADLAQKLGWPILLVAADRLGCINHVLLTLQAIQQRNLDCPAVVLNRNDDMPRTAGMDNAAELQRLISTPVFSVNYTESPFADVDELLQHLQPVWGSSE